MWPKRDIISAELRAWYNRNAASSASSKAIFAVNFPSDYKFSDTQIADALRVTRGNLSDAARLLTERCGISCSRAYLKRATTSRPMLVELVADMTQAIVDKAEDNIFNLVEHGDDKASYFILRTLGKDRGYVPKEEVEASSTLRR
jgi:hypothetical protein